ncbi:MAG TPA: methyltransferase domain-containing protein [Stellaceae bacterium]|jgi:2-polyprenyl-6-hydroxyphenyl methylase/3-demethylubiquinone-9 3-methyltransferase|nr:methyltransferase domain-containing protein [Stellaceae bacterium]
MTDLSRYPYFNALLGGHHAYLDRTVFNVLNSVLSRDPAGEKRAFELGCGNGAFANAMSERGYTVTAIDPSTSGIAHAKESFPHIAFETASAYDDLRGDFGEFDAVVSLEVVEHLFEPRKFAASVFSLLKPEGVAIISTPITLISRILC